MHNGIKYTLVFSLGAAIGSAVTFKLIRDRYEEIIQEEIDSVKKVFTKKYGNPENAQEPDKEVKKEDTPNIRAYAETIKNAGYTDYSTPVNSEENKEVIDVEKPHAITPEDFESIDEYETIDLTYYADDILADDATDEIVEDIENTVGSDFASYIGEYERDTVYIQNDQLKTYYIITTDLRKYADVVGIDPHQTE